MPLRGNTMFFLTIVVFGMLTLGVEVGRDTVVATVMIMPKPNIAVVILLYIFALA
jgi:hypothetical protein